MASRNSSSNLRSTRTESNTDMLPMVSRSSSQSDKFDKFNPTIESRSTTCSNETPNAESQPLSPSLSSARNESCDHNLPSRGDSGSSSRSDKLTRNIFKYRRGLEHAVMRSDSRDLEGICLVVDCRKLEVELTKETIFEYIKIAGHMWCEHDARDITLVFGYQPEKIKMSPSRFEIVQSYLWEAGFRALRVRSRE